jgi:hypothetical protein
MPSFTLQHDLHCNPPAFWSLFFDREFNDAMFLDGLAFRKYEVVALVSDERVIHRRVEATPKIAVPSVVASVLGPSLSYREEGTFERATQTWRWRIAFNRLSEKIRSEGTVRVEPTGPSTCKRIADFVCEVDVFGIGGVLARTLESNLREAWEGSALFANQWFARGRP